MRMVLRALLPILLLPILLLSDAAAAADPAAGPVPAGFAFDGAAGEWTGRSPALTLAPKQHGARGGRVWVAQEPAGLVVAGAVDGPAPRFARAAAEMPGGDHLELWLASVDPVPLPPVGWGHQFGPQELKSAADCEKDESFGSDPQAVADCKKWYAAQTRYRAMLVRLFARQWQMAPGVVAETWAQPAFQEMSKEEREAAVPLPPAAAPQAAFASGAGPGYAFEIRVPWAALPPAADLAISRLLLMVDVFSAGTGGKYGPFSTTSEARRYGRIDTLNRVALEPPRRYRLARCGYPLEVDDFWYEKRLPAYYLPAATEEVGEMFVLENPVRGYQYQPDNASPEVVRHPVFSRELAQGVVLCGPELAVRRGETTRFSPAVEVRRDFRPARVEGGWLVASGPVTGLASRLGTGTCGACPLISLDVLFVPEGDGEPANAYSGSWLVEDDDLETGLRNARVAVDDDLRSIRIWAAEPDENREQPIWTFLRVCYEAGKRTYEQCDEKAGVGPPPDLPMPPGG